MRKIAICFLAFMLVASVAKAVGISDSTTSSQGTHSSLNATSLSSTRGYQNSLGIPVGTVISWSGAGEMAGTDAYKFLECNGQQFNKDEYPELFAILGSNNVPNLNGEFLRATTDSSLTLAHRDETIKSHETDIAPHTHTFELDFSGNVQALALSDTIYVPKLGSSTDTLKVQEEQVEHEIPAVAIQHTTPVVSGIQNRQVQGQVDYAPTLHGVYTGASETAPKHILVRYFIKARP